MRRTTIRLLVLLFAAVLLAPGAISAAAAPGPRPSAAVAGFITASQYAPDSQECRMLSLINHYRRSHGKSSLALSRTLGAAAEHHSRDMAAHNYFSHTLYNGTSPHQNMINHGYPSSGYWGENIAAGHQYATDTFNQWVNSSPHRANMLSGNFKAIGIGRALGSNTRYKWYWTTTFGSTVDSRVAC